MFVALSSRQSNYK